MVTGSDHFCEPGGTRTPNLLIRSQVLYPIKLRVRDMCAKILFFFNSVNVPAESPMCYH